MTILLYLLTGLGIGVVSGLLGIGGGVLLLPILVWFFGIKQANAAGITLAVLAVPVVLPAVLQYYRANLLGFGELKTAAWLAGGFAVGGFLGAWIVSQFHLHILDLLRLWFGLMLIYVAVRFLLASSPEAAAALIALIATAFAWLAYLGLRTIGRRHLPPPDLGRRIRALHQPPMPGPDYHI
jgi:uncharacterized membrane protein YfcA